MVDNDSTSGFIDKMDGTLCDVPPIQTPYTNLQQSYVSKTGYARIFKANRFGKTYILKCLKEDYLYIPTYRMALQKEFEIGLQMDHPNICHTIGLEEIDTLGPTIVMDYIDGETLESFMNKKLLTKELVNKFVSQLVEALEYIHSKQIIHCDLKPSNIMITHNGNNLKLIDFSLSDSDLFNVFKAPGGTSGYIAPELLKEGAASDIRCDIYSFGVICSLMAENVGDKQLLYISHKCMQRDPDKRPVSLSNIMNDAYVSPWQIVTVVILSITAIFLIALIILRLCDVI